MACTPSRLLANQLNAQKSTGPRTAAGKRRASLNARTHGFYCSHALVFGEDEKAFHAMREHVLMEYAPQDMQELLIVDQIALGQWKLRRLQISEQSFYESEVRALHKRAEELIEEDDVLGVAETAEVINDPMMSALAMAADLQQPHSALEKYSRLEQRVVNNIYRAMRELRTLRKAKGMPVNGSELSRSPYLDPGMLAEIEKESREEMRKVELMQEEGSVSPDAPGTGETPVSHTSGVPAEGEAMLNVRNEATDGQAGETVAVTRASRLREVREGEEAENSDLGSQKDSDLGSQMSGQDENVWNEAIASGHLRTKADIG